jgi:hypothetical protein
MSLVKQAIKSLNLALSLDPKAIQGLVEHRVPCNSAILNHPTITTYAEEKDGTPKFGFLGLINGILLDYQLTQGKIPVLIAGVYNSKKELTEFREYPLVED